MKAEIRQDGHIHVIPENMVESLALAHVCESYKDDPYRGVIVHTSFGELMDKIVDALRTPVTELPEGVSLNTPKYVLYESHIVGTHKGLCFAIKNAERLNVPIAVRNKEDFRIVEKYLTGTGRDIGVVILSS